MKASTFLVDKKLYSTPVKFVPVSVREDQSNAPQTVFKKTVYDGAFHTETSVTWRSCATDHKSPRQGNHPKEPLGKVTWYVQAFIRDMSVPASLATLCSDITEQSPMIIRYMITSLSKTQLVLKSPLLLWQIPRRFWTMQRPRENSHGENQLCPGFLKECICPKRPSHLT